MTDNAMRTYVAEINGEAILAFRARDDDHADEEVNGEESEAGGMKSVLLEYDRADGKPLWDGVTEVVARPANALEDAEWRRARDQAYGEATEGAVIDRDTDDDPDDYVAFLIKISDPADDDDDA